MQGNLDSGDLSERLARVRLLVLDVDGVLTDGAVVVGASGESKRFDVRDGTGIKYLLRNDIGVAFVSGRYSEATARMAEELGVAEVHMPALRKWPAVEAMLERLGVAAADTAYVGDDLVDLPVMIRVGLAVAVADAHEEVRRRADAITERPGGRGAVREVAEAILKASGRWDALLGRYVGDDA